MRKLVALADALLRTDRLWQPARPPPRCPHEAPVLLAFPEITLDFQHGCSCLIGRGSAAPKDAYNATQGVRNMSGQHVIARLDAMEATTNARFDALVATTNARFDAVDAQLDIMGWAIMATLAIVGALAGSGLFMGIQLWRRAEALATAAVPAQSERQSGA